LSRKKRVTENFWRFANDGSKIRFVAQERELQPIDFANQEAAIPILERQVRLWPGLMAEWERIGPVAVTSEGYPEHRLSLILGSNDATVGSGQLRLSPAYSPASYRWSAHPRSSEEIRKTARPLTAGMHAVIISRRLAQTSTS